MSSWDCNRKNKNMKILFFLSLGTILLIMILVCVIFLLMLSLPTVITFIPEHIEHAHQSDIISFFADKIDAVFGSVLYCLVLIAVMVILQLFLLFSFVWKSKKDNMIPIHCHPIDGDKR